MLKYKRILAILLALAVVITAFAACGGSKGSKSKKDASEEEEELIVSNGALKVKKVGNLKAGGSITPCEGGLTYFENEKYGVLSSDGTKDTGAKYYDVRGVNEYFLFTAAQPKDEDDIAGINSTGLMDGDGNVLIEAKYAVIEIADNGRFAQAIEFTEKTDSKEESIGYIASSIFQMSPNDGDPLYKGKWEVYDLETGKLISGVAGTKPYSIESYGDILEYAGDDGYKAYVNLNGEKLSPEAKVFSNGTYLIAEGNKYVCYDSDGTKLFEVANTEYVPTSVVADYYNARKEVGGKDVYAIMDKTGKVLSDGYEEPVYYGRGDLVAIGSDLYTVFGQKIAEGSDDYMSFYMDKEFGKGYIVTSGDTSYLLDEKFNIVFQGDNNEYNFDSGDFTVSKKDGDDSLYYSQKDKDFTLKGFTRSTWIVEVEKGDGTSMLVSTLDGETLIDGYSSYTASPDGDYVYARNADNSYDVYMISA